MFATNHKVRFAFTGTYIGVAKNIITLLRLLLSTADLQ